MTPNGLIWLSLMIFTLHTVYIVTTTKNELQIHNLLFLNIQQQIDNKIHSFFYQPVVLYCYLIQVYIPGAWLVLDWLLSQFVIQLFKINTEPYYNFTYICIPYCSLLLHLYNMYLQYNTSYFIILHVTDASIKLTSVRLKCVVLVMP